MTTPISEQLSKRGRMWGYYSVWKRSVIDMRPGEWMLTNRKIKARTINEANNKLRRMFADARFHSMSLMAVPIGENPNALLDGKDGAK